LKLNKEPLDLPHNFVGKSTRNSETYHTNVWYGIQRIVTPTTDLSKQVHKEQLDLSHNFVVVNKEQLDLPHKFKVTPTTDLPKQGHKEQLD
jgi:hypothetical protein